MPKQGFDINVADGVVTNVANDALPFCWMKVYYKRFIQSKSLWNAEIKWFPYKNLKC